MTLFKRILLSLFPDEMINQQINPASMFVGLISSKQFFSVINRKIVENYKLNLFDISLDPFEVKVWFGENPSIKVKDIDFYYGYCAVANLNWYRFFSPANITNSLTIALSMSTAPLFSQYPHYYFMNFLFAINLLGFLFAAQIKVFPYKNQEENYKRFIDLFFNFYLLIFEQSAKTIDEKHFQQIKKILLSNIQIFFTLFYTYQQLSLEFKAEWSLQKEFYQWLFYDELKKWTYKNLVNDFVDNYQNYTTSPHFSTTEKNIINLVLPADILIRYLFEGKDIFLVTSTIVWEIFDKQKIEEFTMSFLKNNEKLEEFISYITDYSHYKKHFFKGVQKFIMNKFKSSTHYEIDQELDDFISSIGDYESIDEVKIPERIKKESQVTERLINFYLTFLGWFWISRGDTFSLRFMKPELVSSIVWEADISHLKQDALFYYWSLLYSYSKNVFYYKFAYENVRAGKEKFQLPFKSQLREVYSNIFILRLFDENFLATILQDTNTKDIKIYLKQKEILTHFKTIFWAKISSMLAKKNTDFVREVYESTQETLGNHFPFLENVIHYLHEKDISNIKESLYTLDFWMYQYLIELLNAEKEKLIVQYSSQSIMGILASARDTLFWFLLYLTFLEQNKNTPHLETLIFIYVSDILNVSEQFQPLFITIIKEIKNFFSAFLQARNDTDDNKNFLRIGLENWLFFADWRTQWQILGATTWEDILWLRGYLKNITYYNKRYLIKN